jgi:hypothetical protein
MASGRIPQSFLSSVDPSTAIWAAPHSGAYIFNAIVDVPGVPRGPHADHVGAEGRLTSFSRGTKRVGGTQRFGLWNSNVLSCWIEIRE